MKILEIQPEELDILTPKGKPSMADWAEDNYVLSEETSEISGPWSNDYVPYLVPIMGWVSDLGTRQITICKAGQAGGSELANITIGFTCEVDPAPTMIVMPREDDANRRMATRIRPMFKANPKLSRHLAGGRLENLNIGKETILDNMILYIAWSNSPAALADNPVAKVILDEVGKYPTASGKEADPISLAKKRQRTFRTRSKLLGISTPVTEGDLFDVEFKKGDQCEWWVPCPHCNRWHIINWFNVELDKNKEGHLLEPEAYRNGGHARYVCPHCKKSWTEYERWEAVSDGKFVPAGCSVEPGGRIAGKMPSTTHHSCRITALMLHPVFQTIDDLAGDWAETILAKKAGNIKPLQDFYNSQLAQSWKEIERTTDIEPLKRHISRYESGIVPQGVQLITGGIDIQVDHMWVVAIGWGYLSEAWLIYASRIETGDTKDLSNYSLAREFASTTWSLAADSNKVMRMACTAVDCGYHTDTVIDFTRMCTESNLIAVRGDDRVKTRVYHAFKLPDKQSIRYDLNVTIIKDSLYRLLFESQVSGPGFFHLPADTTEEILQHLSSEEKQPVRKGNRIELKWVLKQGRANHIWDGSVYAKFAAELVGVRLLTSGEQRLSKKIAVVGKPVAKRPIRTRY